MSGPCVECGERKRERGVLCGTCVAELAPCDGLLPEHVASLGEPAGAEGWLVDGWGTPHALVGTTSVGRRPESGITLLTPSVSRDHAELMPSGSAVWQLRDLGSRNGTHVHGARVQGRCKLEDGARVRFGEVHFLFKDASVTMPSVSGASIETVQAGAGAAVRYGISGQSVELILLGISSSDETGGGAGALLHRATGDSDWSETTLPPLEFRLLETLCAQALAEQDSLAQTRGCVATKQLARSLPFQSRYANEENVRQVVRRVRRNLEKLGATGLVDSIPGRGYFVAWPVTRS